MWFFCQAVQNFIDFSLEDIEEIELLKYTPSSALGSVRFFLEDFEKNSTVYEKILKVFKKYNIRLISWECAPPIENNFR